MKYTKLLALAMVAAFAAGCAGMGGQSGSAAGSSKSVAAVDDATVTKNVQAALAADADLKGAKITVSTDKGAVRLKGEIKSMALRKKADSLAGGVAGVRSVSNDLVITG
jgi:hyperosmotically inducible protein